MTDTCNNCILGDTLFIYDILNTDINDITINYDLSEYIGDFSPQTSGLWLPVFYSEEPVSLDERDWQKITKGVNLQDPRQSECPEEIITPKGLGLADFMVLNNPDLRNWVVVGDCQFKIDWIINFLSCKNYHSIILFWYRYWDINRENDLRIMPGVDIFVSDGDFAYVTIDGNIKPRVTDNLLPTYNRLYKELKDANYSDDDADLKAKILASGPQIDKVTDSIFLDPNNYYSNNRDSYGRLFPLTSNMSIKTYTDIGKNNFITNQYDLLFKLAEKYGVFLEIPENSTANFLSKFWSETGPNVRVGLDIDLYRSSHTQYCGYNTSVNIGDLTLSAKKSEENFTPKVYDSSTKEILSANAHSINYFTINNKIIGYNLSDNVSGIFHPDLRQIDFHGLGGVNYISNSKYGDSCVNTATIHKDASAPIPLKQYTIRVHNTTLPRSGKSGFHGPFFISDYATPETMEQAQARVLIELQTATNSKLRINNSISVEYLRTAKNPKCNSFILSSPYDESCNCFSLSRLHPEASGNSITNANDLIYTPNISLYYLPEMYYYGGLAPKEVADYGVFLPNHPNPGTQFPKTHTTPFNIDNKNETCKLIINDGCGSQSFQSIVPYAGKIILRYASSKASFSMTDGTNTVISPGGDSGIFSGSTGTICLTVNQPSVITILISVPKDEPDTEWGINVEAQPSQLIEQIPYGIGLRINGKKGFFHPNFGWTFSPNFHNKTPVIPNHRQATKQQPNLLFFNYNAYAMYDNDFLEGYNYFFDLTSLSNYVQNGFFASKYIGIQGGSNSFFVTSDFKKVLYNSKESPILESVQFDYVNFDLEPGGYALNDLKYRKTGSNSIEINSLIEGSGRALAYLDSPSYNNGQEFTIYSDKTLDEQDITITNNNKNIATVSSEISSPEFDSGFIFRNPEDNQSIVIYRSNYTINDNVSVGKWGNHTYSEAIYEFYQYLTSSEALNTNNFNHLHNNSFLREKFSSNTSFSWGAPIAFYNNYNTDNLSNYFPVSRLLNTYKNDQREIHVVGYKNQYISATPDGDLILASGNLDTSHKANIYISSYIGDLEIKLRTTNQTSRFTGKVKIFHNDEQIAEKPLSSIVNNILTLNISKDVVTSRYATIVMEYDYPKCADPTLYISNTPKITAYSVKINSSSEELKQKTRISYYGHKQKSLQNKQLSFANNFPNQAISISDPNNIVVAPISLNQDYLDNQRLDYAPYLDLHIFSSSDADKPISSEYGALFFEDFLQPKSNSYLQNMEVPYNSNYAWIDISKDSKWGLLTSKGILFEPNKVYKILKSLNYDCKGDAPKCASRYKENICEFSYNISRTELLDLIGFSEEESSYLNIETISFPKYCSAIDYCCSRFKQGTPQDNEWEYNYCLQREKTARQDCVKYWNDTAKISCIGEPCPTGNISGTIITEAEYYVISVKDDLSPNIKNINETNFHFFSNTGVMTVPCSTQKFTSVGQSYIYSVNCETIDGRCDSIIPQDYDSGSQWVPGEMLDLSSLYRGQKFNITTSDYTILQNELRYRNNHAHPNVVSPPYKEYDPLAISSFNIFHSYRVRSKKCTSGELLTINIAPDVSCTFWAQPTTSGIILISTCFEDRLLQTDDCPSNSQKISKTICTEKHPCGGEGSYAYPAGCSITEDWTCENAISYIKGLYGGTIPLKVTCEEDPNNSENYYYDCRLCDTSQPDDCTPNSFGTSLTYVEPVESECFCPEGSTLTEARGFKECEIEVPAANCSTSENGCVEAEEGTAKVYLNASCSQPGSVPSKEAIEAYEKSCGTENVRTYTNYSVLWTEQSPLGVLQQSKLGFETSMNWADINKALCENSQQQAKCNNACYGEYVKCVKDVFDPKALDACFKTLSACQCSCGKDATENAGKIEKGRTFYYYCDNYCNISDTIYGAGWGFGWGWGWGWGYGTCWNYLWWYGGWYYPGYGCQGSKGPYSSAALCDTNDYNACEDVEERVKFQRALTLSCSCETDYNGYSYLKCENAECVDAVMSDIGQRDSSFKSHIVKQTVTTKIKTPPVTKFEDRESKYSKVKVYTKKFDVKWEYDTSDLTPKCEPSCKEGETCYPAISAICGGAQDIEEIPGVCGGDEEASCDDKVIIDFTVTFKIYRNLIVGTLSQNQTAASKSLYKVRTNTGLFKCPLTSYDISNEDIYVCDYVTSDCYGCYSGAIL